MRKKRERERERKWRDRGSSVIVSMNVGYLHATVELIDGGEREERERERERGGELTFATFSRGLRYPIREFEAEGCCLLLLSLPVERNLHEILPSFRGDILQERKSDWKYQ